MSRNAPGKSVKAIVLENEVTDADNSDHHHPAEATTITVVQDASTQPTAPAASPAAPTRSGRHFQYSPAPSDEDEDLVEVAPGLPPTRVRQAYHFARGGDSRPWHYGLCGCCQDRDACLEVWCCAPCQLSRQYNMVHNEKAALHWPLLLLLTVIGPPLCGFVLPFVCVNFSLRGAVRARYTIEGNDCTDIGAACCLPLCALQQQMHEMTSMGNFPGSFCYTPKELPVVKTEMV